MDIKLRLLDKSRVTTGVLLNRVFTWKNPAALHEGDTISYGDGKQIWHELCLSSYNDSVLYDATRVDSIAEYARVASDTISIAAVNYQYNDIDSNALADGRMALNVDSVLVDAGGLSPYNVKSARFPLICDNYLRSDSTVFYVDPTLRLQNISGSEVSSVTITSPTGGSVTIANGSSGIVVVSDEFLRNNESIYLGIDLNLSGGSILHFVEQFSSVRYSRSAEFDMRKECVSEIIRFSSGPDLKFKGYDEPIATEGAGEVKYYFRLDQCNDHVTNPIIIMDGFDPKNGGQQSPDDVYNLLKYDYGSKSLGLELRQMGYDVVVLNFPEYPVQYNIGPFHFTHIRDGGTDYMERNAMVLIKLINEVNGKLVQYGSTEKIVVIGPSMGGQISRYALKYMQKNNMNHNCRLYVGFDSPNLGANIPLGNQAFLWWSGYILNKVDGKEAFDTKIRSIAARQLLVYQVGGDVATPINFGGITYYKHSIQNSEPKRKTWDSMIYWMGYPTNLRKIAITNGHMFGSSESTSPVRLWDLEGKKAHSPMSGTSMAHFKALSVAPRGYGWNVFNGNIYDGPTYNHYWGGTGKTGSLDFTGGGQYASTDTIAKYFPINQDYLKCVAVLNSIGDVKVNWDHTVDYHYNTFIPTVSALGFYHSSFNWNNSIWRNLICSSGPEIPFDDYFAPSSNEGHVQISISSAPWIKQQIQYKGVQGVRPKPEFTSYQVSPYIWQVVAHFPAPPPNLSYSWSINYNGACYASGSNAGTVPCLMSPGQPVTYTITTSGICSNTWTTTAQLHTDGSVYRQARNVVEQLNYNVAPNPTHDVWTIGFPNADKIATNVRVTDIQGRSIINQSLLSNGSLVIDAIDWPGGIYVAIVTFSDGTSEKIKLHRY